MSYKEPLATTTDFGILKVGNGFTLTNGVINYGPVFHGLFTDSTTQTNPVVNTANTVGINTTEAANGISIVGGNAITFANAGVYTINMNMQISKTDAGSDTISIWLAKNGTNIANTNIEITLTDTSTNSGLRAGSFLVTVAAGDNIQVKWSSADIAMRWLATAAQVTPTRPATPCVRIVVTQT